MYMYIPVDWIHCYGSWSGVSSYTENLSSLHAVQIECFNSCPHTVHPIQVVGNPVNSDII